jgi:L-lactate dehydrogenase complex protein LldF
MRKLRERDFEQKSAPAVDRWAIRLWGMAARRPALYRLGARVMAGALARMGGKRGVVRRIPFGSGWTATRDMPAPAGRTFQSLWAQQAAGEGR